jgi:hypothetical protein
MIEYQLVRDCYRLELALDDDSRRFTLVCQPRTLFEQPDIQLQARKWCQYVARGFAQRHGIGYSAQVKLFPCDETGTLRGEIVTH